MLNCMVTPIDDVELENYLENKLLNFRSALDKKDPYKRADYVIIANRMTEASADVVKEVYTHDLFGKD